MPGNTAEICRDDDCVIEELHTTKQCRHLARVREPAKPIRASSRPAWKIDDPAGLSEAVMRAVPPGLPTHFSAIADGVRNDYGSVHERTIYRHIRKVVERGELLKVDLRLGFAAYIRPKAKLLSDLSTMRDVMSALVDLEPDAI